MALTPIVMTGSTIKDGVKKTCLNCNTEFMVHKCRYNTAKFCSRKCKSEYSYISKTCEYCKKEFKLHKHVLRWHPDTRFCSKKCWKNSCVGNFKCKECGKIIIKIKAETKRRKFCGRECFSRHIEKARIIKCDNCKSEIRKTNWSITNTKKSFCSSQCKQEFYSGANSPMWEGGICRLPYGFDFNKKLKKLIRERDGYKCQQCGADQQDIHRSLDVHHIDMNKKNNHPDNLISFCKSCHKKIHWMEERCLSQKSA